MPYTDDFSGAAGNLSAPWVQGRTDTAGRALWRDGAGHATSNAFSSVDAVALYAAPISNDQYVQCVPNYGNAYVFLGLRATSGAAWYEQLTPEYYMFLANGVDDARVLLGNSAGSGDTSTELASDPTFRFAASDVLRLQVIGTTIKLLKNGVEQSPFTCTDATLTTGYPFIGLSVPDHTTMWIDNFEAGDAAPTALVQNVKFRNVMRPRIFQPGIAR